MGNQDRSPWRDEGEKSRKHRKEAGSGKGRAGAQGETKVIRGKKSDSTDRERSREIEERRLGELERKADSISKRQSTLSSLLAEAEELSDGIEHDTRTLTSELVGEQLRSYSAVSTGRAGSTLRDALKALAQDGAGSLEVKPLGDGSASIRVDFDCWILIPPRLAQLLEILTRRDRPSGDRFPPWRSLDEVAEELGTRTGRTFTRHAVTQLVSRLRKRLERRGVNPFLVATCRERGARFLLADKPFRKAVRVVAEAGEASGSARNGSSPSGDR